MTQARRGRPIIISVLCLVIALGWSGAACFKADDSNPLGPTQPTEKLSASVAIEPQPLLYSTLNNLVTINTPVNGSGLGAAIKTNPARDFVPGRTGNGVRINAKTEYVRFRERNGAVQNVELDQGTVDFWYQPAYANTDGQAYRIFGIGTMNAAGSIALQKRVGSANNDLYVLIRDGANRTVATSVAPPNYSWVAGQWINIRVTWNSKVAPGVQNTRIFLNGQEVVYATFATGPFTMRAEASGQYIYLGNVGASTSFHGNGVLDDFKTFGVALDPVVPPTDSTPPTVSIDYPGDGSVVSSAISVKATASDDFGVAGVQFQVDGVDFGAEDVVAPFAASWNTAAGGDGPHAITAIARDAAGNRDTSDAVIPLVNNTSRPSVIVILTDDQRYDQLAFMPNLNQYLVSEGVQFANSFVSHALCCPSRATLLTGQYSHNHRVETNTGTAGGMARFNHATALPVPLQRSGYLTGYFGKYFNDYHTQPSHIPAGWTDWRAFNSFGPAYFNYTMNENGVTVAYGGGSPDYSTNVIAGQAAQFITSAAPGQPFFLVVAPSSVHEPSIPDIPDQGAMSGMTPWRPFSYNEEDISDKPSWVQNLPLMTSSESDSMDLEHQRQAETLLAVDRGIGTIMDALAATGRLDNTVIIYTSDNGLAWGEHRWVDSKLCPYEECIRVPLLVRAPGIGARIDDHMVQNVDLAPTIAELADVALLTSPVNGRSLLPLLRDPNIGGWRTEIFHETFSLLHPHVAVRTAEYLYVEYVNGDRELYDLIADPSQMLNVHGDPTYQAVIPGLQALLRGLEIQ